MSELYFLPYLVVGALVAVVAVVCAIVIVRRKRQWTTVSEGKLGRVEYGLNRDVLVIYFFHGDSTVISDERLSVPYPKGTRIKVQRNDRGRHRIKKA